MGSIFQSVIIMVTFTLLESECEVQEGTRHSQLHWLESVMFRWASRFLGAFGDMELDTSQGRRDKASGGSYKVMSGDKYPKKLYSQEWDLQRR